MNKELLVVTNKKMIKKIWEAHNNEIAELNNKIINKKISSNKAKQIAENIKKNTIKLAKTNASKIINKSYWNFEYDNDLNEIIERENKFKLVTLTYKTDYCKNIDEADYLIINANENRFDIRMYKKRLSQLKVMHKLTMIKYKEKNWNSHYDEYYYCEKNAFIKYTFIKIYDEMRVQRDVIINCLNELYTYSKKYTNKKIVDQKYRDHEYNDVTDEIVKVVEALTNN